MSAVEPSPIIAAPPLVFRGRLDEDDVVYMYRYRDRVNLRLSVYLLMLGWCGLFAGISFAALAAVRGGLLALIFSGGFALLALGPFLRDFWSRWHYRRHVGEFLDTTVTITDREIKVDDDVVQVDIDWSKIRMVADTIEGLLFVSQAGAALFWLPNRVFSASDLRRRVLDFATIKRVPIERPFSIVNRLPRFTLAELFLSTTLIAVGLGFGSIVWRNMPHEPVSLTVASLWGGALVGAGVGVPFHRTKAGAVWGACIAALLLGMIWPAFLFPAIN